MGARRVGDFNSPPLEGCPKGGVVAFRAEVTTPSGFACHPSTGGELYQASRGANMRNTSNYMSLPYNPALKERARELCRAGNLSEVLFWKEIKNGGFLGLDFDRQKIIGNYIVDFYCAEKQVVVEIDGSSHDNKVEYDAERDALLTGLGLTVIHIPDIDVKRNLDGVLLFLQRHPGFE